MSKIGPVTLVAVLLISQIFFLVNATIAETADVQQLWVYSTGGNINKIVISENGEYIAALSREKTLYLFNRNSGLLWDTKIAGSEPIFDVSADGSYIVVGSTSMYVSLYDRNGTVLWEHKTDGYVSGVDISGDGMYIAASSKDGTIHVFDIAGNTLWQWTSSDAAWGVTISDDSKDVAGYYWGQLDGIPHVYKFDKTGKKLWQNDYEKTEFGFSRADFGTTKNGSYFTFSLTNKYVYLIDRNGTEVWKKAPESTSLDINIVPEGQFVVCSDSKNLYAYDLNGSQIWTYYVPGGISRFPAISMTGKYIDCITQDHRLFLLDLNGTEVWQHDFEDYSIISDVSGDGQYIAVASDNGDMTLFRNVISAGLPEIKVPGNPLSDNLGGTINNSSLSGQYQQSGVNGSVNNSSEAITTTSLIPDGALTTSSGDAGAGEPGNIVLYGIVALVLAFILIGGTVVWLRKKNAITLPVEIGAGYVLESEDVVVPVSVSVPDSRMTIDGMIKLSGNDLRSFRGAGLISLSLGCISPGKYVLTVDYHLTKGSKVTKGAVSKEFEVLPAVPEIAAEPAPLSCRQGELAVAKVRVSNTSRHAAIFDNFAMGPGASRDLLFEVDTMTSGTSTKTVVLPFKNAAGRSFSKEVVIKYAVTSNFTKYVFISHAHQNKSVADQVCQNLEERAIKCWIAPRDVFPGAPFEKAIMNGINNSSVFVLIFSALSNASSHVANEILVAGQRGIPIVNVQIEDTAINGRISEYISAAIRVNTSNPPTEAHLESLYQAVKELKERSVVAESSRDGQGVKSEY